MSKAERTPWRKTTPSCSSTQASPRTYHTPHLVVSIIPADLSSFGGDQSFLALVELGFCCYHSDRCRVVAEGLVQSFMMIELVLKDRDLPRYFVDKAAKLVDMAIFTENYFHETHAEDIN
jgi:hypothetical protein